MNELFDEVRAALYSAWSRKWLVLGVAWAVCLAGWLFVATIPNTYESQARIFIQLDDVLSKQIGIAGSDMTDIARVRQRLASASTLGQVVESTRLGEGVNSPRAMEVAIGNLAQKVKVKSEEDNLFEITAQMSEGHLTDNENAQLARDVVNKLLEIFRQANVEGTRGEVSEAVALLDRQLDQRAKELEEAEARRTAFEAEHPELIESLFLEEQASDTGAYTLSMWSRHCSRGLPPVWGLDGGDVERLFAGESPQDVVRFWGG